MRGSLSLEKLLTLSGEWLYDPLWIEKIDEPVVIGEYAGDGVVCCVCGRLGWVFDLMLRHLDDIEHFVDEQAVPVVMEADHEVSAAGSRGCADQTKPALHVNHRYDPAPEMEEADHGLRCVRYAGDPSVTQHLSHAR